jgi:hypothetical protein
MTTKNGSIKVSYTFLQLDKRTTKNGVCIIRVRLSFQTQTMMTVWHFFQ